jgi:hypothetical protein
MQFKDRNGDINCKLVEARTEDELTEQINKIKGVLKTYLYRNADLFEALVWYRP